jgi:hypothetical protein
MYAVKPVVRKLLQITMFDIFTALKVICDRAFWFEILLW